MKLDLSPDKERDEKINSQLGSFFPSLVIVSPVISAYLQSEYRRVKLEGLPLAII